MPATMRRYLAYTPSQLVDLVTEVFLPDPGLIATCCRRRRAVAPLLVDWLERELTSVGSEYEFFPELGETAVLLLAEWREPVALGVYERVLRSPHLSNRIAEEIFYRAVTTYGRSAVPMLSGVVSDPEAPAAWGRSCAVEMLGSIASYDPSTRDEIVGVLRGVLPALRSDGRIDLAEPASEDLRRVWTSTIAELGRLKDVDSISHVMAAFDADCIDEEVLGLSCYEAYLFGDLFERPPFRPGLYWLRSRLGFVLAHVMVRRERLREAVDRCGIAPRDAKATAARSGALRRGVDDRPLRGYFDWIRESEAAEPVDSVHASCAPVAAGDLLLN